MAQPIDTQEHEHSHLSTVEARQGIMTGPYAVCAWHQHGLSCRGALHHHDDVLFAIGTCFRAFTLAQQMRRFVRLEIGGLDMAQKRKRRNGNGHTTQATCIRCKRICGTESET